MLRWALVVRPAQSDPRPHTKLEKTAAGSEYPACHGRHAACWTSRVDCDSRGGASSVSASMKSLE